MKIEHIALWCKDIEKMKDFYCRFFQGKSNARYQNKTNGFQSYFITFSLGCRLELMSTDGMDQNSSHLHLGYAHLAFSTGHAAQVDALTDTLSAQGYTVVSGPRTTGDGYYESCILDPEGNRVEITI